MLQIGRQTQTSSSPVQSPKQSPINAPGIPRACWLQLTSGGVTILTTPGQCICSRWRTSLIFTKTKATSPAPSSTLKRKSLQCKKILPPSARWIPTPLEGKSWILSVSKVCCTQSTRKSSRTLMSCKWPPPKIWSGRPVRSTWACSVATTNCLDKTRQAAKTSSPKCLSDTIYIL